MTAPPLPALHRRRTARRFHRRPRSRRRPEHPTHHGRPPSPDRSRHILLRLPRARPLPRHRRPQHTPGRWPRPSPSPTGPSPGSACRKPQSIAGTPARLLDFFAGHHNGYCPGHPLPLGLRREIQILAGPRCGHRPRRVTASTSTGITSTNTTSTILPPTGHTWSQSIEPWDWSPVYGRKEPAYVLRFSTETGAARRIRGAAESRRTQAYSPKSAPGDYRYKEPQGSHEFIFTADRFTYRATRPMA